MRISEFSYQLCENFGLDADNNLREAPFRSVIVKAHKQAFAQTVKVNFPKITHLSQNACWNVSLQIIFFLALQWTYCLQCDSPPVSLDLFIQMVLVVVRAFSFF